MVDWSVLSPAFLTAAIEWAGTVVTVLAGDPGQLTKQPNGEER